MTRQALRAHSREIRTGGGGIKSLGLLALGERFRRSAHIAAN